MGDGTDFRGYKQRAACTHQIKTYATVSEWASSLQRRAQNGATSKQSSSTTTSVVAGLSACNSREEGKSGPDQGSLTRLLNKNVELQDVRVEVAFPRRSVELARPARLAVASAPGGGKHCSRKGEGAGLVTEQQRSSLSNLPTLAARARQRALSANSRCGRLGA